ncbi:hypothetical protein C8R47DRAFT_1218559 [Mycena vitilis]|nr:hypothetical protein C8R47DRAFT_1218559 [Mycena vitilis]
MLWGNPTLRSAAALGTTLRRFSVWTRTLAPASLPRHGPARGSPRWIAAPCLTRWPEPQGRSATGTCTAFIFSSADLSRSCTRPRPRYKVSLLSAALATVPPVQPEFGARSGTGACATPFWVSAPLPGSRRRSRPRCAPAAAVARIGYPRRPFSPSLGLAAAPARALHPFGFRHRSPARAAAPAPGAPQRRLSLVSATPRARAARVWGSQRHRRVRCALLGFGTAPRLAPPLPPPVRPSGGCCSYRLPHAPVQPEFGARSGTGALTLHCATEDYR